ncbi:MAG: extracellular solute-binding protein [Caldilinea sp.]|nr:extracellular solute-binding protein [Caldilinea sp.]MCB0066912.1 extracellular solute-binding protein [Caldilineaceae bacterium]MCB0038323.1 extracellular solute-binding protein [Caldilinea sp.]MCB0051378.1 extracellular solute-binding protein [Caldilinea sp.]MCB0134818.1 extracellular solute-binding protein [Caldilineaceae bacterium]
MRKSILMLLSVLVIASMLVSACGGAAPAPAAPAQEAAPAEAAPAEAAPAEAAAPAASGDRVQVRWFIGLGTGADAQQIPVEEEIVKRFNESQDRIELVMEVVPNVSARDTLATQIASGNGPDIIGPVGWDGSNSFYGQYLDLAPYMMNFDAEGLDPALINMYQTETGAQVGLPFLVFPAVTYYQKEMFDEAGLNYPPASYGEKYVMPDGTEVDWNWATVEEIAKILTVDANGNDATSPDFDKSNIVQYGFSFQWQTDLRYIGSYLGGAAPLAGDDGKTATVPESWVEAWKWWHNAMWGDTPIAPSGPVLAAPEFQPSGFASERVALSVAPSWYTCCIADAGETWDLGVMPTNAEGVVNSRMDADTFRILKDTKNPDEAYEVLSYLLGDAAVELATIYGGMPARLSQQQAFFDAKKEQFPFVTNWDAIVQGLAHPDVPSAEAYMPNYNEARDRVTQLETLVMNEATIDLDAEAATLQADLQSIFDRAQ